MDFKKLPKTEFAASIAQLAGERGIEPDQIISLIEQSLISAYKRDQKERGIIVPEEDVFEVDLAPDTGSFRVFKIDGEKKSDVTPPGFGRIAAQTAMNVLRQGLSALQTEKTIAEYQKKIGTLINGIIVRIDPGRMIVSLDRETEAVYPKEEQVRNDNLTLGQRKVFLLKEIVASELGRKDIILSRRDPKFIEQLFAREVPEVSSHSVVINKVAREAGERSKVAVSSTQAGIDPVGSCIGQKGSRIQAILNEIPSEEKVDVILFSKNIDQFIAQALSPAEAVKIVSINSNQASVTVPESQLALAIGSGGENVRLAGQLVGLDIQVKARVDK